MGQLSGLSGLGGIASGIGSLFGGGGSSSSGGGGGGQAQAPSDAPVDTPGPYSDPTQSVGASLQDLVQQGAMDPEITARENQRKQQQQTPAAQPAPTPPPTQQANQQLAQLAQQPQTNPWQLGAPQGMNPLTQNRLNLAGQMPVTPSQVGTGPPTSSMMHVTPAPLPGPSVAARPDVASSLRNLLPGGAGAQDPTIAAGGPGATPVPTDPTIAAGGPGAGAGAGQAYPPAPLALTRPTLSDQAANERRRQAIQASTFNQTDHDQTIPRSGNPGLDQVKSHLAQIESGAQSYGAVGPTVTNRHGQRGQGIGKYQIMSYNVGPWSERFLGQRMTPQQLLQNPRAQDRLANAVMTHLHRQYANWQDVASVWRTGHPVHHHFAPQPHVFATRPQMPAFHHGRS